jgi:hypothetical protein
LCDIISHWHDREGKVVYNFTGYLNFQKKISMRQILLFTTLIVILSSCDQKSIDDAGTVTGKLIFYVLLGFIIYYIAIRPFTKKKK